MNEPRDLVEFDWGESDPSLRGPYRKPLESQPVPFTVAGGAGIVTYVILWIIVPQKPLGASVSDAEGGDNVRESGESDEPQQKDKGVFLVGVVLTVMGVLLLMNNYLPFSWLSFSRLGPLLIIFVGIVIILKGSGGKDDED